MRAPADEAVGDDTGKDEDHGDEPGQVSDVLLRPKAAVVMGRRRQVDGHVDRERGDGKCQPHVDEARHAPHVGSESPSHLYH